MRKNGIVFNSKKIYLYFVMLILGFSLVFYGIISYSVQMFGYTEKISDQEIIERAKDLGMVEVTEQFKKKGD